MTKTNLLEMTSNWLGKNKHGDQVLRLGVIERDIEQLLNKQKDQICQEIASYAPISEEQTIELIKLVRDK